MISLSTNDILHTNYSKLELFLFSASICKAKDMWLAQIPKLGSNFTFLSIFNPVITETEKNVPKPSQVTSSIAKQEKLSALKIGQIFSNGGNSH